MSEQIEKSTFLLKSKQNSSFGTAFCIHKDEEGSYLITCAHVIDSCDKSSLIILNDKKSLPAKLLYIGSSDDIDLAIIYVKGLKNTERLLLTNSRKMKGIVFEITGFKSHKKDSYLKRILNGSIEKISDIQNLTQIITTYELKIEDSYNIEKGYSGSAIIFNGKVIGVATDKNNGKQAYGIPIGYVEKIWENMPNLLSHPR